MFSIEYDEIGGFIRCRVERCQSPEPNLEHVAQAKRAIDRCRALHDDVKMLVMFDGDAEAAAMMQAAGGKRAEFDRRPNDRSAFVVPSSLAKCKVANIFDAATEQCFLSENAAIKWLLAEREMRSAKQSRAA